MATIIVSPRVTVNEDPQSLQNQPPIFGVMDLTDDVGGPIVYWYNTIAAAVVAHAAVLDIIVVPVDVATALKQFRWVRRVTGTNTTNDPSGGTSRQFDGRCVQVYRRYPFGGASEDGEDFILVKCNDGSYIEDVASRWVVAQDR